MYNCILKESCSFSLFYFTPVIPASACLRLPWHPTDMSDSIAKAGANDQARGSMTSELRRGMQHANASFNGRLNGTLNAVESPLDRFRRLQAEVKDLNGELSALAEVRALKRSESKRVESTRIESQDIK